MRKYTLKLENAKACRFEFLEKSGKAPQINNESGEISNGGAQRCGLSGGDLPSEFLSSPYFALLLKMQESPYYDTFFGVGGKFLTEEGRKDYDKQAFNFVDRFERASTARLSKTSSSIHGKRKRRCGCSAVRSGKSAKNEGSDGSSMRRPAPCAERAPFDDSCLKRSVFNDNIDYNAEDMLKALKRYQELERRFSSGAYPKNYPFEYSTDNGGGNDEKLTFDDEGKLTFNLLESRSVSVPSIKPFFDDFDLIKNPSSGSFCGFDGGCQLSLFGFWKDCAALKTLVSEVGDLKEYVEIKGLKCASLKAFKGLHAWKVAFNAGRGRLFGRNISLPFSLSYGGIEIFINITYSQEEFDFSDEGTGGELALNSCMTKEGQDRLKAKFADCVDSDERRKRINEHFRALAGGSLFDGAFVLPCGGSRRSARVSIGVIFGAQVFRTLGLSLCEAGRLVKQVLASIGFVTTDETIGRFDFGFITDRFSVQQLRAWDTKDEQGKNIDYRFVCPAGRPNYYGDTLQFGRRGAAAFLRMYDKRRQLRALVSIDGGDKLRYFYNILGDDYVFNMEANDRPLTRVEWEFRRDALQNMRLPDNTVLHVRTLEDLEKALPSIIKYFCFDWFRITESSIVDGHSNEAIIWSVWQEVADACVKWASWLTSNENKEVPKLIRETKSLENLPDENCAANKTAQGFGRYLVSVGRLDFNRDLTENEMIEEFRQLVKRYKKQINRSWHREGSELIDRQRLFDSRAVPSSSPYDVDVSTIPNIVIEDENILNGFDVSGVGDDRN